jgi:hypothetical protein
MLRKNIECVHTSLLHLGSGVEAGGRAVEGGQDGDTLWTLLEGGGKSGSHKGKVGAVPVRLAPS